MRTETSRRAFLGMSGLALTAASLGIVAQPSGSRLFAYVGRHTAGKFFESDSNEGGGIDVFRVNLLDGSLVPASKTGAEVQDLNSDAMCVSADGRFLYSVNLTNALGAKKGAGGGVAAFAINHEDGSLRYLNTQPSMGGMPESVMIDKTNSRVVVANYGDLNRVVHAGTNTAPPPVDRPIDGATVALFAVRPDGSLEAACDVSAIAESGAARPPLPPEWAGLAAVGAACHAVAFDRTQRFIIATDNGHDHLYVYPFSPGVRKLQGKSFETPPGKAPRHLAVHPRIPYFFMTNELEASVSSFHFNSTTGDVRPVQTIATIPDGYSGPLVSPSDIRLHPSGRFVYSVNRGNDTVAIFAIDQSTGRMSRVGVVSTGGNGPREMNIEPSGHYLFVCNTDSSEVVSFALDGNTGMMSQVAKISVPRAAVVNFAVL